VPAERVPNNTDRSINYVRHRLDLVSSEPVFNVEHRIQIPRPTIDPQTSTRGHDLTRSRTDQRLRLTSAKRYMRRAILTVHPEIHGHQLSPLPSTGHGGSPQCHGGSPSACARFSAQASPTLKLIATTRRGGRGESIGWVSYRQNEAQELGHDAMRVGGEDPTTARNSPIVMATHAKLVVTSAPRRPGDALGLVP
jgi:hypothetical protein